MQVCTYQYKACMVNGKLVEPNTAPCSICGFNFKVFKECNFKIAKYYEKTGEKPPKDIYEDILYESLHKRLSYF